MKKRILAMLLPLLFLASSAAADEYRPAYLEIIQTSIEQFDVLWKVPAMDDMRLALYVRFSADAEIITPVRTSMLGGAFFERYSIRHDNHLADSEIAIEGLYSSSADVLVRIERLDGSTEVARLASANPSFVVKGALTTMEIATTYLKFGVEHILEGIDHLLFVACLILIAGSGRRIFITITGFTLAHSITLTLAALNLVQLPIPPIEAVIALSIVFLAREIVLERRNTLTWRYPIMVSASFGLLHGFGFASALGEIGLPQAEIPAALLAFNLGVEIGQVLFVSAIIVAVCLISLGLKYIKADGTGSRAGLKSMVLPRAVEKSLGYAVGGITIIWTVQRTMVFWA